MDSPPRGFSPRELRKAKFSPPDYITSKQMSGIAPAASGSRVPLLSVLTTDSMGVQRGSSVTPFAGNPKTRRFLARLSSISSRQEMDRGCGPRRPAIDFAKVWRMGFAHSRDRTQKSIAAQKAEMRSFLVKEK